MLGFEYERNRGLNSAYLYLKNTSNDTRYASSSQVFFCQLPSSIFIFWRASPVLVGGLNCVSGRSAPAQENPRIRKYMHLYPSSIAAEEIIARFSIPALPWYQLPRKHMLLCPSSRLPPAPHSRGSPRKAGFYVLRFHTISSIGGSSTPCQDRILLCSYLFHICPSSSYEPRAEAPQQKITHHLCPSFISPAQRKLLIKSMLICPSYIISPVQCRLPRLLRSLQSVAHLSALFIIISPAQRKLPNTLVLCLSSIISSTAAVEAPQKIMSLCSPTHSSASRSGSSTEKHASLLPFYHQPKMQPRAAE